MVAKRRSRRRRSWWGAITSAQDRSRAPTARAKACWTAPMPSPTGLCSMRLLSCASGATWVSIHHGGGVGIGYTPACGPRHRVRRQRRRGATACGACCATTPPSRSSATPTRATRRRSKPCARERAEIAFPIEPQLARAAPIHRPPISQAPGSPSLPYAAELLGNLSASLFSMISRERPTGRVATVSSTHSASRSRAPARQWSARARTVARRVYGAGSATLFGGGETLAPAALRS